MHFSVSEASFEKEIVSIELFCDFNQNSMMLVVQSVARSVGQSVRHYMTAMATVAEACLMLT